MKSRRPKNGNRWLVTAMYLVRLGLVLLFWLLSDSTRWEGGYMSVRFRFLAALLQAIGPVALPFFASRDAWILVLAFTLTWTLWLALVLSTRLRNLP